MAVPFKFYLTHISGNAGYRANWEPNKPLVLGMVGKLTNGVFDVITTLEQEGFQPEVLKDSSPGELDYTSNQTVDIDIKLAGKAPSIGSVLTEADAGFVLDFKGENAVVFQIKDTLTHQVMNLGKMEHEIVSRFKNKNWPKDWLIITQLVEAVSATIIVSNSANNKIELKATANAGTPNLKLTDANLGLTVAKEKGSSLKVIAQAGITPLYRVMGIRHPLFGKVSLKSRGIAPGVQEEEKFRYQDFDARELEEEIPAELDESEGA
jgi:hypothetical protein